MKKVRNTYDRYWKFRKWLFFDVYCFLRGILRVILGTRIKRNQFREILLILGNKHGYPINANSPESKYFYLLKRICYSIQGDRTDIVKVNGVVEVKIKNYSNFNLIDKLTYRLQKIIFKK